MLQDEQSWKKERAVKIGALGVVLIGALVVMAVVLGQESSKTNQLVSKNNVVASKDNGPIGVRAADVRDYYGDQQDQQNNNQQDQQNNNQQDQQNNNQQDQANKKNNNGGGVAMRVAADNWISENSCRNFCYDRFYQMNYNYPNYLRCEQMCFNGRYSHWQPHSSSCTTVCYAVSGTGNCNTICSTF